MIGMKIEVAPGQSLVTDDMLNGVVMMILFTCIISTMMTEHAAQQIILRDKEMPDDNDNKSHSEEKILIPMKYPEYAQRLVNVAMMMRNPKNTTGLVGLNVVYDDDDMRRNMEQGQQLLDRMVSYAASADMSMQTQVRVAANIANGIKHAFKEFRASAVSYTHLTLPTNREV